MPPKLIVPPLRIVASPENFAKQSVTAAPELPQTRPALQLAAPPSGMRSATPNSTFQLSIAASVTEPAMPPVCA